MSNLTKNANEIFAFKTKTDRDGFISDLPSGVRYAVNIDPDATLPDRWLVAVPKAELGITDDK